MHATGTRLAVAMAYARLRSTTGGRLPGLLMVRNNASELLECESRVWLPWALRLFPAKDAIVVGANRGPSAQRLPLRATFLFEGRGLPRVAGRVACSSREIRCVPHPPQSPLRTSRRSWLRWGVSSRWSPDTELRRPIPHRKRRLGKVFCLPCQNAIASE